MLSRFAGFPLQVTDSAEGTGYGTHVMGGAAWGGQRAAIVALAMAIRTAPEAGPANAAAPAVVKPAMPPGQWLDPQAWTWAEATITGTGMDGKVHTFAYSKAANTWAKVL